MENKNLFEEYNKQEMDAYMETYEDESYFFDPAVLLEGGCCDGCFSWVGECGGNIGNGACACCGEGCYNCTVCCCP